MEKDESAPFAGSIIIGITEGHDLQILTEGNVDIAALYTASGLLARMAGKMLDDFDTKNKREAIQIARDLSVIGKGN